MPPSPDFHSSHSRYQRLKRHAISISHAKQIIVRLLKALMNTARPPLKVAELEGDAVFFYAPANGGSLDTVEVEVAMGDQRQSHPRLARHPEDSGGLRQPADAGTFLLRFCYTL